MAEYEHRPTKSTPSQLWRLSRRGFLQAAAVAAGAGSFGSLKCLWGATSENGPPTARASSVVAICSDEQAFRGMRVRSRLLRDLVDQTVVTASGKAGLVDAWGTFVHPGQSILLKFASLTGAELGTSLPLLEALLASLEQAGHKRQSICVADCAYAAHVPGLPVAAEGWGPSTLCVGGFSQPLRRYLEGVDAIINVPCLCDHSLVGVGCSMANVSLSLMRHPGRYAGRELHQAIAETCAADSIRQRVKLTLVNALRAVFQGGPVVEDPNTIPEAALWASTDMVAIDRLALEWLDRIRKARGLPALDDEGREPKFLALAAGMGLGCDDLGWIDRRRRSA